jgi:putative CocE/NonD family hydrolase
MKPICAVWLLILTMPFAAAQSFDSPIAEKDPAALARAMPGLADAAIAVYRDDDQAKYLDNLFRLQIVAGRYAEAIRSLEELQTLRAVSESAQRRADDLQYLVYARALLAKDFDAAFRIHFQQVYGALDDRAAALAMRAVAIGPGALRPLLDDVLRRQSGRTTLTLDEVLELTRTYQAESAFRRFAPLAAGLIAEDDERRYVIDSDIAVAANNATVCALVLRLRSMRGRRLPTLLNFTIYADPATMMNEARRTASHGYAGVIGLTRGKGCSPDVPVPYEHDGTDAAALIDWIAAQPWSDGRVGMYGGSYEGFTQWAAAKYRPKALKALMPSVAAAPGIDVPKEGNVFFNFVYYWPFHVTSNKTLDQAAMQDRSRWWRTFNAWYAAGSAYREMDRIEGPPNPLFRRWLEHPGYDAYWQAMIPYGAEFADIDIPVLTTTGYYDDAQPGALYYFREHSARRANAEHYLLIGPYDHIRGQRGTVTVLGDKRRTLRGYETDPMAQIDLGELRYQWFDYLFKGAPKPVWLRDKVNYQVMGANVWKHAPSLEAMGEQGLRFHLASLRRDNRYRLTTDPPIASGFVTLNVDMADRSDAERKSPADGLLSKSLDAWNGVVYASEPFSETTEISGLFAGQLDFITNKRDMDLSVTLYELTPGGDYLQLSSYLARASYMQDRTQRRLLTPGRRQRLAFTSERMTSRRFRPGSRLVVVLGVVKQAGFQINYGSGKDVSDETVADAGEPLRVQWFDTSYLDIPIQR